MAEEASVIPSDTSNPVFSSSATLIPKEMTRREAAYWKLKMIVEMEGGMKTE